MIKIKNIPMVPKLLGLFLAVGLLPMALVSWLASEHAHDTLMTDTFNHLESIREIKKGQIQAYMEERRHDLRAVTAIAKIMRAEALKRLDSIRHAKQEAVETFFKSVRGQLHRAKDDPLIHQAIAEFSKAFTDANHRVGTSDWNRVADQYRPRLTDIAQDSGWSDFLLLNAADSVVFTTAGRSDLGLTIPESFLKNTSLGLAWHTVSSKEALDTGIFLSEFFPYPPNDNKQTAFMIAPITDVQGTIQGYVTTPIGSERINAIVQHTEEIGKSGEPYLVGRINGTTLYRSDRTTKKGQFGEPKKDPFVEKALSGETGSEIKIGSTGLVELVSYAPLHIPGLQWAVVATISAQEAITPSSGTDTEESLFSQYVEEKGLADMLLISPDGNLFYSVHVDADYQTNLINGPFAHTHLGQLVQATLKNKTGGITDFAPYDPSGGVHTAFMVQPILAGNEIELLVALQLKTSDLDTILQKREGMGTTGETFLVGEQHGRVSYRNDRIFNRGKTGQTPQEYLTKVTSADHEKAGMDVVFDETQQEELISHTKLDIPGLNWTLLATQDAVEVERPIQQLFRSVTLTALGLALLVALAALWTARSITSPVHRLMMATQRLASGEWSARAVVDSTDEIGKLGTLFNQLAQFIEEQYWLQASQAQFAELIQKSGSPKELAQQTISQLAELLQVGYGVVYVLEEGGQQYKLLGSFGYSERKNLANTFAAGEALVGQCALENKPILLTNAPSDYIKITSGLGESTPLTILAVPISFRHKVLAVIEIASFNPISVIQRTLLEKLTQTIGLGLENQFRQQRTQDLLVETQTQAEELASQQEELRRNNEELQQQAQTLRLSEETLRVQQEELQTANEQLRERTE